MTMLDWGLTGAAVLLLLFAIRAVTSPEGKERLGCGFGVVTALLWAFVLRRHIPDIAWFDTGRVALGVLLVLPAARALAQPKRGALAAAACLVLAFVVAGPVVARLWTDHAPDFARTRVQRLELRVDELDDALAERRDFLATVEGRQLELEAQVAGLDLSAEDLADQPEVERKLAAILRLRGAAGVLGRELLDLEEQRAAAAAELADAHSAPQEPEPADPADRYREFLEGLEELPALDAEWTEQERLERRLELEALLDEL